MADIVREKDLEDLEKEAKAFFDHVMDEWNASAILDELWHNMKQKVDAMRLSGEDFGPEWDRALELKNKLAAAIEENDEKTMDFLGMQPGERHRHQ